MHQRTVHSCPTPDVPVAMTNAVSKVALSAIEGRAGTRAVPRLCSLRALMMVLDTIAGGAASVIWYLAAGDDAEKKYTEPVTSTISISGTTGVIHYEFDEFLHHAKFDWADDVKLHWSLDAGTANGWADLLVSDP